MVTGVIKVDTSVGPIELVWGINHWVLITAPGDFELQIMSRTQLEQLFVTLGVPPEEAVEIAVQQWGDRPAGSGSRAPRSDQGEGWEGPGVGVAW